MCVFFLWTQIFFFFTFNPRLFILAYFLSSASDPVMVQITEQPLVGCSMQFDISAVARLFSIVKFPLDGPKWMIRLCFCCSMLHDCITCGIPLVFSVNIEVIFLLWAGSKKKIVFYPLCTYLLLFSPAVFPGIREIAFSWFHQIFVVSIFKEWKMTLLFSTIVLWVCCMLIYKRLEPTCVFCLAGWWSTWPWPGFKPERRRFSPALGPLIPRLNPGRWPGSCRPPAVNVVRRQKCCQQR